jgi:hypothetical protein
MGTWGPLAFDNDNDNDWAYDLDGVDDLSLVDAAFGELEAVGSEYLEQHVACNALAACEVVARLGRRPGYQNAYTEKVDRWVAKHRIDPSPELVDRATAAISPILGPKSELVELWEDADPEPWRAAVADLRSRLAG